MKVPKGERPFWSLFGDIGTTIFSYDFIYDNLSPPCVQASIDQWIGDWTCTLEVRGSNLAHDKPFFLLLSCIFLSIIFEKYFFFHFFFDLLRILTLIMILSVGIIIILNL